MSDYVSGVTFGETHSREYGLILAHLEISEPETKETTVDVPGGDSVIDYTDYFGEPKFKDRKIAMTFLSISNWSDHFQLDAALKNNLHGLRMNVVFDDDPDYYWDCRLSVGAWLYKQRGASQVTVTARAKPFKMKSVLTEVPVTLSENGVTVTLENERKSVCPLISSDSEITLIIGETQYVHAAGEDFQIPAFVVPAGGMEIEAFGTGTATIKYREGSL